MFIIITWPSLIKAFDPHEAFIDGEHLPRVQDSDTWTNFLEVTKQFCTLNSSFRVPNVFPFESDYQIFLL